MATVAFDNRQLNQDIAGHQSAEEAGLHLDEFTVISQTEVGKRRFVTHLHLVLK